MVHWYQYFWCVKIALWQSNLRIEYGNNNHVKSLLSSSSYYLPQSLFAGQILPSIMLYLLIGSAYIWILSAGTKLCLQKLIAISVLLPGACRSALKNAVSDDRIKQSIPLCTPGAVHHLIFSKENSHHQLKILILVDCVLCATLRVYYSLFNLLNSCVIELWGRLTNAISI